MKSLRTALLLLAIAGVIFGLVDVGLMLASRHFDPSQPFGISALVIGWSFIGTGLFAWWRRPENHTGALMTAVGFASLIGPLFAANAPVYIVGAVGVDLFFAVLVHMLLAYPSGRIERTRTRVLVVASYVVATVFDILPVLFLESAGYEDCPECPPNPILVAPNEVLGQALSTADDMAGIGIATGLIAVLASRWRRADRVRRRELAPVLVAGGATFAIVGVLLIAFVARLPRAVIDVIAYGALTALVCVPFAFLAGILRSRLRARHTTT